MLDLSAYDALRAPHVCRGIFAEVDLPDGLRRLHTGVGKLTLNGVQWEGVTDPFGAQIVAMSNLPEPRFGEAPYVDVTVSGANRDFLRQVWTREIDGCRCDFFWAAFDAETGGTVIPLTLMFEGRLTGVTPDFAGRSLVSINLKVVSMFEALNFPSVRGDWSSAGQRARHPGDAGMDPVGSQIVTVWNNG